MVFRSDCVCSLSPPQAALKKYQVEHKSKGESLEKCQGELKKLRRKSQGSKNPSKYGEKEIQVRCSTSRRSHYCVQPTKSACFSRISVGWNVIKNKKRRERKLSSSCSKPLKCKCGCEGCGDKCPEWEGKWWRFDYELYSLANHFYTQTCCCVFQL